MQSSHSFTARAHQAISKEERGKWEGVYVLPTKVLSSLEDEGFCPSMRLNLRKVHLLKRFWMSLSCCCSTGKRQQTNVFNFGIF